MDQEIVKPNPKCVGQEFVRQYYTMLNEAPQYMHRFYSNDSSYIHGGIEKPGEEKGPILGQAEIHKKIMSLNFENCHARICQIDCQETVNNAVLVQLTGELSNAGQPMRQFMQTFVLASQSPKKFYVYNDIFRYQDEVFLEIADDKVDPTASDSKMQINGTVAAQSNGYHSTDDELRSNNNTNMVLNGTDTNEVEHLIPITNNINVESIKANELDSSVDNLAEKEKGEIKKPVSDEQVEKKVFQHISKEVKNDASLNEGKNIVGVPNWASRASMNIQAHPANIHEEKNYGKKYEKMNGFNFAGPRNSSGPSHGGDSLNGRYYGNQIFVGGIPCETQPEELKLLFKKFGEILDVKILQKRDANKLVFGFVKFAKECDSLNALKAKVIEMNNGHILKLEESRSNQTSRINVDNSKPAKEGSRQSWYNNKARGANYQR